MTKRIIVAIDGLSSCGKSTIAKRLAKDVGYMYVDTGAMYRCVGYYCLEKGIISNSGDIDENILKSDIDNIKITFSYVGEEQHTFLNGKDVEAMIRNLKVGEAASKVSAIGFVREAMVRQQKDMGINKGIVMDGRDIGTVVFPDAELKIFVTADADVRAQRRYKELIEKGENVDYQFVLQNINDRDYRDLDRAESPLKRAKGAKLLDNSSFDPILQQKVVMDWFLKASAE